MMKPEPLCKKPLVSIALCTYNGAKFLAGQLDSIIDQTYDNLEIIIVDDSSDDETPDLINAYASKYPQIKFFINSKNLGFNKNFEKAISLTSGEYIAIADQDDIWLRNKIELLLKHIGDNWLIFSNSTLIDSNGKELNRTLLKDFNLDKCDYRSFIFQNYVTGHSILMKRELLKHILPIPETGYYDWWLGFIAMYQKKISYLDQALTKYRLHPNSVIQTEISLTQSSKADKKNYKHLLVKTNLENLICYPFLKSKDRECIEEVKTLLLEKEVSVFSWVLFKKIYNYYNEFFPDSKKRRGLSLIIFATKYAKGFKEFF